VFCSCELINSWHFLELFSKRSVGNDLRIIVSGFDDQDGRIGRGEGVEYGNVTPPSDSGSQSPRFSSGG